MGQGQGRELMSDEEFGELCDKAYEGKTAEVLAAVDQDRSLATRAWKWGNGATLLIATCNGCHDNPELVQGLLEREANLHARDTDHGQNALMLASRKGNFAICDLLLERGADVHAQDNNGRDSLMLASYKGHVAVCTLLLEQADVHARDHRGRDALIWVSYKGNLEVCLLLISHGANLSRTALDRYGESAYPRLTFHEREQGRAAMRAAFETERRWAFRWPVMNVMAGCGFRPLAVRLLELELQRVALSARGGLPPPTVLDTPERRRAYFMGQVFGNDGLLRLIVLFL